MGWVRRIEICQALSCSAIGADRPLAVRVLGNGFCGSLPGRVRNGETPIVDEASGRETEQQQRRELVTELVESRTPGRAAEHGGIDARIAAELAFRMQGAPDL
jgi:hypothetical protein